MPFGNVRVCEECLKDVVKARFDHLRPMYQTAIVVRLVPPPGSRVPHHDEARESLCMNCGERKSFYSVMEAVEGAPYVFQATPDRK